MEKGFKGRVLKSLFWKLLEQTGYQGIQFAVALLLARLLTTEEYGTVSLIMIFITIANTFVQSGFATALIQKTDIREEDYSSVFWLSLLLSLLCYIALFLAAPWIAGYYGMPLLQDMVRVMGLVLFPGAVISIQTAYVSRELRFERLFRATMIAVVLSGVGSVFMAYRGFGAWAMAAQQLLYYFALMAALFVSLPWRPRLLFSFANVRALFSFGWKILVSGLIDTLWQNIYGLIIGKKYSGADLGMYTRGDQFPKLLATNLTAVIQSVMLPTYARMQEEKEKLYTAVKRSVQLSAFLVFPMMAGMFAVARPMVTLLLTDKWAGAVPYLCLMCVSYMILPVHAINLQVINALGHSELFLKLEILKKLLGLVILLFTLRYGIFVMLCFRVVDEYLCLLLNAWPNGRLIGYGPGKQLLDMLPPFLCAFFMGVLTYSVQLLPLTPLFTLLLQLVLGVLSYAVLSVLLNRELIRYLWEKRGQLLQRSEGR